MRVACVSLLSLLILSLAGCSAGAGSGNGNNVTVTINNPVTSVQADTAAISFTATAQNDSTNSGVSWSLTANGSACSPTCGSLSEATSTTVTYTPPTSAPASPNNQPTLTATSVAKTSKSATDAFTITSAIIVTITNTFTSVNTGANAFVVNATVQNDSTNSGVSWTLTANGTACSPACGSLSGATTTSITYAPPSSVPANQPTLTATSVHDTLVSASDSFTIQKPAIVVSIEGKFSSATAGSGPIPVQASVQNDPSDQGVTWTLKANGTTCTMSTCGTVTAINSPSFSAQYNPPASVPSPPYNTPTITATSVADATKSATDAFTITAAPAISVTVSQIKSVLANTSGVNFSANVQNDPSGDGVNWTLTVGGSACSTACGSLSNNAPTSVTYTPPATAPAGANDQPTVTATSVANNSESGSDTFTITSNVTNSCGAAGGDESLLNGHYAILTEGFSGTNGTPIFIGASFAANGSGGVTGGEEDVNDTITPQHLTFTSGASNGSLYTVGSDHRGCLQLTNSAGTPTVFRFALGGITSGVASAGSIIEFDDNSGTGAGSRGSGILRLQTASSFVLSALANQYAFGVNGWTQNNSQYYPFGGAGWFSNSSGSLSNGVDDLNIGGLTSLDTTGLSGTLNGPISASTGRTTGSFDLFDWAIYVVNSSELFVVGTDPTSSGIPNVGRAIATPSSFTASTVSGSYILHTSGNANSASSVDLQLLTMTPGGGQAGTFSGTVYSYGGGNGAGTTNLSSLTYNVSATSSRTTLGNTSNSLPILYLTTPTDGISAFVVGVNADAQAGLAEFQPSETYTTASAAGTYYFATEDPESNSIYNKVGAATISSGGSSSGTVDLSTTAGLQSGQAFSATLDITSSNGTGNMGTSTVAIVNGTKIFYIDETVGVILVASQ